LWDYTDNRRPFHDTVMKDCVGSVERRWQSL
jgi:hypothetical protein